MAPRSKKPSIPTAAPTAEHPIIVLIGSEIFLRTQWTSAIRDLLTKAHGEFDTFRFQGDTATAAEVLDECRSFGLMSGHKLVIVDDADKLLTANERPLFERYAAAQGEGATLLLRCDSWVPNEKKLLAAVQGAGVFVDCFQIENPAKAVQWCGRRAKSGYGSPIEREAAEMLVRRYGPDLARLDSELAKLSIGAGEGPITPDLVISLGAGSKQDIDAFKATSELLSGNASSAIHQIREVLDSQTRDSNVPAIWSAVSQAGRLHAYAAGKACRVDPKRLRSAQYLRFDEQQTVPAAAARLGRDRAKSLFDAALTLDANSKSGVGNADRGLETLAVRFALALRG